MESSYGAFHSSIDHLRGQIEKISGGRPMVAVAIGTSSRISWYACGGYDPRPEDLRLAEAHAAPRLNGDGFAIGVSGLPEAEASALADLVHAEMCRLQ